MGRYVGRQLGLCVLRIILGGRHLLSPEWGSFDQGKFLVEVALKLCLYVGSGHIRKERIKRHVLVICCITSHPHTWRLRISTIHLSLLFGMAICAERREDGSPLLCLHCSWWFSWSWMALPLSRLDDWSFQPSWCLSLMGSSVHRESGSYRAFGAKAWESYDVTSATSYCPKQAIKSAQIQEGGEVDLSFDGKIYRAFPRGENNFWKGTETGKSVSRILRIPAWFK